MKKIFILIVSYHLLLFSLAKASYAGPTVQKQPAKSDILSSETDKKDNTLKSLLYLARPYRVNQGMIYSEISPSDLVVIKDSPFDSFGIATGFPYHRSPPRSTVALIKEKTKKKIWPRMLIPQSLYDPQKKEFGLWNDDKLAETLTHLKEVLRIAKETNVPGIIIDPELYYPRPHNNYSISSLAQSFNKTPAETIQRLHVIGQNMADSVHNVFGEKPAILWFLFTNLASTLGDGYRYSIAYLIEGILSQAKQKNYNITLIDGGETSIKYVNLSLSQLRSNMTKQYNMLSRYIKQYDPHFKLGATTVLFNDVTKTKGVWAKLAAVTPPAVREVKSVEDYVPILKELFNNYEYVWIYWDGGNPWYNDFDPRVSNIYRPVIEAALPEAYKKAHNIR